MQAMLPKWFTARKGKPSSRRGEPAHHALISQESAVVSIELLEQRLCFATVGATLDGIYTGIVPWLIPSHNGTSVGGGSDQISTAKSLGSVGDDHSASGTLSSGTDVNLFSFTVQSGQRVAFDVDVPTGATLNSYLRVFDSAGHELAANDNGAAPNESSSSESYVQFTFPTGGTYYVGVSGSGNAAYNAVSGSGDAAGAVGANGAYTLHAVLTGGGGFNQISGTATMNGQSTPIALQRFGPTTTGVDPTVRTWVLVHGRNGTGHTTGLTNIANTILRQFPQDQVLTLDWSQAAASPTYFDTEQWIPFVGQAAAQLLITHGFAGASLNFIGYSFGTYVSGEAAKVLPGGVNTMALIDPPVDAPGGYDASQSLDFRAESNFSWAFHDTGGSVAPNHSASSVTPRLADEAFDVTNTTHGSIIALFEDLISGSGSVAQRFQLSRLLNGTPGPWMPDQFSDTGIQSPGGGYEAVISTTGGTIAQSLFYVGQNGQTVTE
jgi:pimeloyl-ACP methyl ester carboxylesterase